MNQEIWRAVTPQYDAYEQTIASLTSIHSKAFMKTQNRLSGAIEQFIGLTGVSRVMMINAPDNALYRNLIAEQIKESSHAPDSVIYSETLNSSDVFGQYKAENGKLIQLLPGLLDRANNGYLILTATFILANPRSWLKLKSAVLGQGVSPLNMDTKHELSEAIEKHYNLKIVIVGDREQLADIDYLDADIHSGLCLFSELELELPVSHDNIELYLGYLNWITESYSLPALTPASIERLLIAGARYTEDQGYIPICLMWHLALLQESALVSDSETITFEDIDKAIENKKHRESYLPERALSDILDGQVIIETNGNQIGQVNALTVIDVAGHPLSYGEPARISCVIHFGDGDVSDVERKVDLAGNLHAKGMMIMQAFVSSALQLDEPLPYSASLVFEQSYSEVDGDSASLAELCCFVSALSEYPINQEISVTGAVDQFGRVQAVGGLNEKIEGFYHVCKHQGFTGNQGVILPRSNLKHLALDKSVIESIKTGEFHIWPVSNVDEAVPILMDKPFRGDDDNSVVSKIAERIENFERLEHPPGIVERFKNWLSSY
ncbi:Lon protease family protein [uncultured Vibrio sp.]|uniref:Lon protease family protein n=1 Tax=uncultured Vibrio sp. TaxID=114054 RepID=UPI000912393C|nr:Lon protease family protein [uncultured Vibrio sp.]OIQ26363.1 MAG: ATP-dependent protease [Vibrio sp. MedPE-SWchi]